LLPYSNVELAADIIAVPEAYETTQHYDIVIFSISKKYSIHITLLKKSIIYILKFPLVFYHKHLQPIGFLDLLSKLAFPTPIQLWLLQ